MFPLIAEQIGEQYPVETGVWSGRAELKGEQPLRRHCQQVQSDEQKHRRHYLVRNEKRSELLSRNPGNSLYMGKLSYRMCSDQPTLEKAFGTKKIFLQW